ncbi:MAG: hypothetical protein WC505_06180 [Patescibacteria group bacterium]
MKAFSDWCQENDAECSPDEFRRTARELDVFVKEQHWDGEREKAKQARVDTYGQRLDADEQRLDAAIDALVEQHKNNRADLSTHCTGAVEKLAFTPTQIKNLLWTSPDMFVKFDRMAMLHKAECPSTHVLAQIVENIVKYKLDGKLTPEPGHSPSVEDLRQRTRHQSQEATHEKYSNPSVKHSTVNVRTDAERALSFLLDRCEHWDHYDKDTVQQQLKDKLETLQLNPDLCTQVWQLIPEKYQSLYKPVHNAEVDETSRLSFAIARYGTEKGMELCISKSKQNGINPKSIKILPPDPILDTSAMFLHVMELAQAVSSHYLDGTCTPAETRYAKCQAEFTRLGLDKDSGQLSKLWAKLSPGQRENWNRFELAELGEAKLTKTEHLAHELICALLVEDDTANTAEYSLDGIMARREEVKQIKEQACKKISVAEADRKSAEYWETEQRVFNSLISDDIYREIKHAQTKTNQ